MRDRVCRLIYRVPLEPLRRSPIGPRRLASLRRSSIGLFCIASCLLVAACKQDGSSQAPSAPVAAAPAPAPVAAEVPQEPRTPKKKHWTGISMANLKETPAGVPPEVKTQITHVYRASPGDRAGLKKGDMITAVNDQPVARFQDIGKVTKGQQAGFTFNLSVLRDGKSLKFPVTIEEKPEDMRLRMREAWEGTPWVPFSVQGINASLVGKPVTSDSLKGKVVVLDFWATWCGPCRMAMPKLEDLERELGPKGLVVLGISSEEEAEIQSFLKNRPLAYQVARDPKGEVKNDYEIDKLPTLYVIDRKGIVRQVGIGAGHIDSLEATVRGLL